mmetsp:Transcript_40389/g.127111  ORF Transcript_40389/g.127111 Transcript_40389/m.127111 type:complete len:119 (-) Transcript_40389:392-748(-)
MIDKVLLKHRQGDPSPRPEVPDVSYRLLAHFVRLACKFPQVAQSRAGRCRKGALLKSKVDTLAKFGRRRKIFATCSSLSRVLDQLDDAICCLQHAVSREAKSSDYEEEIRAVTRRKRR